MGASLVFDDVVMICEFYRESGWPFFVDLEGLHVVMGGYGIDLVMENGHLMGYFVEGPDGVSQVVDDLDVYFQCEFDWVGVG